MKKLIVIADWSDDSLTCQEFRSALEGFVKDPYKVRLSFVSATPSTIHTSYLMRQVVEIEERYGKPLETVIFQNTDPRIQTNKSVEKAKGAEFVVIKLVSGIYLCGPNAGYDFSFIKHKIDEMYIYKGLDKGTQFRSRDLYSRVSAHLMDTMEDELDLEEISTNNIPELSDKYVGHIDNYGNIKTTFKKEDMKGRCEVGEYLNIHINGVNKKAKYVSNLFGGSPGELVIYPGSSGEKADPYLEISIWRHFTESKTTTGLHEFNFPKPGMKVELGK